MKKKAATVESALRLAKSHTAKGNVEKARHFYLSILAKYPQNKKAKKGLETLEYKAARQNQPFVEWKKSDLAQQEFSDLIALYSAGKLNEALREAKQLCQANPTVPLLHNTLGAIHAGLGKLDAAVTSYERAVELKPDYVEAHYNLGNALRGLGQLDAAVASCERALKLANNDLNTLQNCDLSQRQPDLTQQEISSLIALYSAGKLNEALREAKQLCQANPTVPLLHNTLGAIHAGLGKLDAAVTSYERAVELKPDYVEVHNNLGDAFRELGQLDAAVASCRQALELKPDYAEAHNNLGNVLRDLGQLDGAVASYERALELKPDYAEAHNNLGNTLTNLGQLDGAVASYEQALKIKPDFAQAHCSLGVAFKDLGQLDSAVTSYERALKIKPDFAQAHCNLGVALTNLGQLDSAVTSYERALKIKPDFAQAHCNLGVALTNLGQLDGAVASYERALELKPDYAEAHNNLGNTLTNLGQLDAAVASCERALELKPDFAEAHNNLGNALTNLGQLDAAVTSYERALKIKPDFADAQHMFNALSGKNPQSAPKEYIENLFNSYANKFEDSLVNKLEYETPSLLRKTFLESVLANQKTHKAIDLGCGTGLCGVEFRSLVEVLIGIDLSEKMISKAREKNIYDELYVNELISGLETLETKFDLFISSDVFVYIGDLLPLFKTIKNYANKNSLFIFSTEDTSGDDFYLRKTGRFSHSNKYIVRIATKLGFKLEHFERSNLRKDKDRWVIGGIYILRCI